MGKTCSNALCPPPTLRIVPEKFSLSGIQCHVVHWMSMDFARWFNFNGLHGDVSQKKAIFIVTAVRTSNPACNTRHWTRTSTVRSQCLTSSAMARPWSFITEKSYNGTIKLQPGNQIRNIRSKFKSYYRIYLWNRLNFNSLLRLSLFTCYVHSWYGTILHGTYRAFMSYLYNFTRR
jgi:hypothetical protein